VGPPRMRGDMFIAAWRRKRPQTAADIVAAILCDRLRGNERVMGSEGELSRESRVDKPKIGCLSGLKR
jgi:hypothetical protein